MRRRSAITVVSAARFLELLQLFWPQYGIQRDTVDLPFNQELGKLGIIARPLAADTFQQDAQTGRSWE